jgi:hypothetical protein
VLSELPIDWCSTWWCFRLSLMNYICSWKIVMLNMMTYLNVGRDANLLRRWGRHWRWRCAARQPRGLAAKPHRGGNGDHHRTYRAGGARALEWPRRPGVGQAIHPSGDPVRNHLRAPLPPPATAPSSASTNGSASTGHLVLAVAVGASSVHRHRGRQRESSIASAPLVSPGS